MKRILWVDDLRDPPPEVVEDALWVHAKNSTQAIWSLQAAWQLQIRLDEVWLDGDLGGEDSGEKVVKYLLEYLTELNILKVIVHSQNPIKAKRMYQDLRVPYDTYRASMVGGYWRLYRG